jgi:hypothetical protein
MGVIDWVRKIFASYECPASGKKRHRSDEEEEEEIEELIAIDII